MVVTMSVDEKYVPVPETADDQPVDPERARARKHLEERRGLWTHLFVYAVTNAFLTLVWLLTGTGYFWPGWVLAGWGVGLVMHGWDYYWRWHRPVTEAAVDAELRRSRRR